MRRIYFVRHGETDHNVQRRIQGPLLDDPLNAHGVEQARRLEAHFARLREEESLELAAVYSSPMKRAWMTAEAVARGARVREVTPLPAVIEFSWGVYLGKTETGETMEAMKRAHHEWTTGNVGYELPEGESPRGAFERGVAGLAPLVARHADGDVAVVAHGRINKILLAGLVAEDLRRMDEFPQGNTAISLVERIAAPGADHALRGDGVRWHLHYVNRKDHLTGLDPKARIAEGPDSPLV